MEPRGFLLSRKLERKLETEDIDIRFGVAAAQKGFLNKEQILEASSVLRSHLFEGVY